MKDQRQFYLTTVKLTIISEDKPFDSDDMDVLKDFVDQGSFDVVVSGTINDPIQLNSQKTARLLMKADIDTLYFGLDQNGNNAY